jgi:hypothetical protein
MSVSVVEAPEADLLQLARIRERVGDLLPNSQVDQLLTLWRECHAEQGHCSVSAIVERVAAEFGLDAALTAQLRLKLFSAVLARQSLPTGRGQASAPVNRPEARPAPRDAATRVFLALIGALDDLANGRFAERWGALCAALVRQLDGQPAMGALLGVVLRGDAAPADAVAAVRGESVRRDLVHHYYLALCEVLGPVQADRLLSEAVRAVEQQPTAAQYAPRRLL